MRRTTSGTLMQQAPEEAEEPLEWGATMDTPVGTYNAAGLSSLLGYGRKAHVRSGGVCQLCGCGAGPDINFVLPSHEMEPFG